MDFNIFFYRDLLYLRYQQKRVFTSLFQQQLDPLFREDPRVYRAHASSPVKKFRIYHREGQLLPWIYSRFSVAERGNSGKHLKAFETGVVVGAHAREREKRVERQLIANVRDLSGRGRGDKETKRETRKRRVRIRVTVLTIVVFVKAGIVAFIAVARPFRPLFPLF